MARANRPALLLADEPTGELDSTTAETIFEIFHSLNRAYGLTVMIVSHDPQIARYVERPSEGAVLVVSMLRHTVPGSPYQ